MNNHEMHREKKNQVNYENMFDIIHFQIKMVELYCRKILCIQFLKHEHPQF